MVTFENWIKYLFDRPVTRPEWYWSDEMYLTIDLPEEPVQEVEFITRTFEHSGELLAPYCNQQVALGLNYICNPAISNPYLIIDLENDVPMEARVRCLQSIYTVYEQVFAPRCSAFTYHTQYNGDEEWVAQTFLNWVCYMWWDVFPPYGQPEKPERAPLDQACLAVMEKTLQLPSIACQEGALHGLGHWARRYPPRVQSAIDLYLSYPENADSPLREYALAARGGHVL